MNDLEQRHLAALGLVRSADAHERGEFLAIEVEFDEFDRCLSPDAASISDDVLLAFSFWDAWVDSSQHSWHFYEPLEATDWPRLARELATHLRGGTERPNPILLEKFAPQPIPQSWYSRLWNWLTRRAG